MQQRLAEHRRNGAQKERHQKRCDHLITGDSQNDDQSRNDPEGDESSHEIIRIPVQVDPQTRLQDGGS